MTAQPTDGAFWSFLQAAGLHKDAAFLRQSLQIIAQTFMDMEVSGHIAASLYERNQSRRTYRNGYREYFWKTMLGDIPLRIPKLRKGAYFPRFLADTALEETVLNWMVEAAPGDISADLIGRLRQQMGLPGVHRSLLADLAEHLHDLSGKFQVRSLDRDIQCLMLLDFPLQDRRFAALAVGIKNGGERRLLAIEILPYRADHEYWRTLMQRLNARGVRGIDLLVSPDDLILQGRVPHIFRSTTWRTLDPRIAIAAQPEIAGMRALIEQLADQDALAEEVRSPVLSIIALHKQPLASAA